jgi:hypothetical protein
MAWLFRYTDSLGRCCARCLCYFSSRLVIRFIQIVRVPSPQRTHSNRTGLASWNRSMTEKKRKNEGFCLFKDFFDFLLFSSK